MMTYDRNRNAITTGSRVMISGTGKTGVIKAIHSDGLDWMPRRCAAAKRLKWKDAKVSSNRLS